MLMLSEMSSVLLLLLLLLFFSYAAWYNDLNLE